VRVVVKGREKMGGVGWLRERLFCWKGRKRKFVSWL
jgi:hypothetical protein